MEIVSEKMLQLGVCRSSIRELFEFGKQRAQVVGPDKVYDFSIGNPSTPAPKEVDQAIRDIVEQGPSIAVHGYTSAGGDTETRAAIADDLNARFHCAITANNLFLTCGAAAALCSAFRALTVESGDEFIALAPFFPEYSCFAAVGGGVLKVVPPDTEAFQIQFGALEQAITPKTRAVIVNSPNNPSGVVYTETTIRRLAELLEKKSKEIGHPIFILSDEPYRELTYDGIVVPYIPAYYPNTIICYSYSKSLSMPGERIGYFMVPPCAVEWETVYGALAGAARSLGYVCAPSLLQKVLVRCAALRPDLSGYTENRNLLYSALTAAGYRCAKPDGTFYLFVEAPGGDASEFSERAKKQDLLVVSGAGFGCPSHFRISYCVDKERILGAIPVFEALIDQYRKG